MAYYSTALFSWSMNNERHFNTQQKIDLCVMTRLWSRTAGKEIGQVLSNSDYRYYSWLLAELAGKYR